METQRLDKILASTGKHSRKEARVLIRAGRVLVDGVPVRDAAAKFDAEAAHITVDGADIGYRRVTWVMLNKPAGYLSATEDRHTPTVLDLLPPELRHLFPVGRLDKDTVGLLLLTDDGATAHALLSPRHHVGKVYEARVSGRLTAEDVEAFRAGVTLADGLRCLPAELEILSAGEAESVCRVTVREGKFHQVRRMLAERGKPVLFLERVKMGNLPLDRALSRGSFRFLTADEIKNLGVF
ncbi:MAG: rRNA pseudouridine synthase [Oscillospiraceae bacterium]|nr:rRNA pseudouridine synthase [Oscillospiraceae bacterium]